MAGKGIRFYTAALERTVLPAEIQGVRLMSKHRKKKKRQQRLYRIFRGFVFMIKSLPTPFALGVGKGIGLLSYYLSAKERKIAQRNLASCPLLRTHPDLRTIARNSFKHQGLSAVEFIKATQFSKSKLLSMVRMEGQEYIDEAFREGKGVILITPHLGNWEFLGIALALSGYPTCPLVQTQRGKAFDRFINESRAYFGMRPIPVGFTLRRILQTLAQNQMVVYVMDQNADQGGIEAEFLGRKAKIARGAAVAAQKSGALVVAGSIIRIGPWRHLLKITPVEVARTDNPRDDIKTNTKRFGKCLSAQIMAAPEQWLWSYKRKWVD